MPSPGGSDDGGAAAAVCCMCGDHAMPHELFRCKLCRLRLQHRHCSELYPRAATYRQCNWCLREDGGGSPARQTAAAAKKRTLAWSEADDSDENKRRRSSDGGCWRSAFCTEPDKPVKKSPKARHERAVLPMPEMETPAKGTKPRAAAEKGRFRVKVRRYKLLAEVISC